MMWPPIAPEAAPGVTDGPDSIRRSAAGRTSPRRRGTARALLVERLWPRGLTKAAAALDAWDRDIAPSPALRSGMVINRPAGRKSRSRYLAELAARKPEVERLRGRPKRPRTLVLPTRDPERSSAAALRELPLGPPA